VSNDDWFNSFNKKITALLGNKESIEVNAREIFSFSWDEVCFERNGNIKLRFLSGVNKINYTLSFDKYFIDESYVPGSPTNKCFGGSQQLKLKKKYPGKSELIEIFLVNYKNNRGKK
jgi:hypothetical protein